MILDGAENGKHTGMILIDIQKAFETLNVKQINHLNGLNWLSDPIIWIWTAVYLYQINWKNAANFC